MAIASKPIAQPRSRRTTSSGPDTEAASPLASPAQSGYEWHTCRSRRGRMPSLDALFNAFVTILVTIDPPGLAPLFLALTGGMNRSERNQVAVRASVIGFGVLALFAIAGSAILSVFGITLPAFRVAGGMLLFYIAFEMIFERRQE